MAKNGRLSRVKLILLDHVGNVNFVGRFISRLVPNVWHLEIGLSHALLPVFHIGIMFINVITSDLMCPHALGSRVVGGSRVAKVEVSLTDVFLEVFLLESLFDGLNFILLVHVLVNFLHGCLVKGLELVDRVRVVFNPLHLLHLIVYL